MTCETTGKLGQQKLIPFKYSAASAGHDKVIGVYDSCPTSCSVRLQESFELVELDLAGAVLVDFFDKFLDVNCHLELFFYRSDQLLSVDATSAVGLSAHCNVCIEQFRFVRVAQSLYLLLNHDVSKGVCFDQAGLLRVYLR